LNKIITFIAIIVTIIVTIYYYKVNHRSELIVSQYKPHIKTCSTQGIFIENGIIYESCGGYSKSLLISWEIETGKVLKSWKLSNTVFAEGLTHFNGLLYLLSWKAGKVFILDKNLFKLRKTIEYVGEGWGLTSNDNLLIMSNGTQKLFFINPATFKIVKTISIHSKEIPIGRLNELEWINGEIWANVYKSTKILVINPQTGQVLKHYDLKNIMNEYKINEGVLNGIAYDKKLNEIWLTGKNWPLMLSVKE